jgi:hypothetical protein
VRYGVAERRSLGRNRTASAKKASYAQRRVEDRRVISGLLHVLRSSFLRSKCGHPPPALKSQSREVVLVEKARQGCPLGGANSPSRMLTFRLDLNSDGLILGSPAS